MTAAAAVTVLCSMFCGCGYDGAGRTGPAQQGAVPPWQYVDTAMGTVVRQTIYAEDGKTAGDCSAQVMELLTKLEREEVSWRLETSEVYRLNASAGSGEALPLSEDMAGLLDACMELWERSGGAFDVTLGGVARLWDIDGLAAGEGAESFRIPEKEELAQALLVCGSDKMKLTGREESDAVEGTAASGDGEGGQPRLFLPAGMQLDLGAVGKGLAMTKLRDLLEERPGLTGAVISLGGGILTYGAKPDGSPWNVGIVDPLDTADSVGILSLEGGWCVSTSGDYERYVEADGVRYHHILDPATGAPARSGVRGVTILTRDGLLSDGLSTACFVLGPEAGMALAGQYGAEALFVMADGTIEMTDGIKAYFKRK